MRRIRKSPQYLLVISQGKTTVSTILRKTLTTSAQKNAKVLARKIPQLHPAVLGRAGQPVDELERCRRAGTRGRGGRPGRPQHRPQGKGHLGELGRPHGLQQAAGQVVPRLVGCGVLPLDPRAPPEDELF